jgi:heptosyltransferase-2
MTAPILVRLPNHLGDACMCLPALDLLAQRGHAITLLGKRWAGSLFGAYGWPLIAAGGLRVTAAALRDARRRQPALEALLFTNSLGSALQCWIAGLPASGYATDGRGWLQRKNIVVPAAWHGNMHTVAYYHALAANFTGMPAGEPPARLTLRVTAEAHDASRRMLADAGVSDAFIVLCPAAVGRHRGQVKAWRGFGRLATDLSARGYAVLAFPGPGETAAVRAAVPGTVVLPETDVATFAATLAASRLVVANDSGAGHVAAAVDAPLLSVFGVTEPWKTRPWGPHTRFVGSERGWPTYDAVLAAALAALA